MKKVFNKLVRDKMEEVWKYDIENTVVVPGYDSHAVGYKSRIVDTEELQKLLSSKLGEEVDELISAYEDKDSAHITEELADVLEVLHAIASHSMISFDDVEAVRLKKKEKRGGFEKGLYLEWIEFFNK